jgi:hypothetical protein
LQFFISHGFIRSARETIRSHEERNDKNFAFLQHMKTLLFRKQLEDNFIRGPQENFRGWWGWAELLEWTQWPETLKTKKMDGGGK